MFGWMTMMKCFEGSLYDILQNKFRGNKIVQVSVIHNVNRTTNVVQPSVALVRLQNRFAIRLEYRLNGTINIYCP